MLPLLAPFAKNFTIRWCTFSRSYGTILPSSFTRVLSSALVFSTCPPVLVWGTVYLYSTFSSFSWKLGINTLWRLCLLHITPQSMWNQGFASISSYMLVLGLPAPSVSNLLRHYITHINKYRNINLFYIGYASQLHLSDRLTLLRLT